MRPVNHTSPKSVYTDNAGSTSPQGKPDSEENDYTDLFDARRADDPADMPLQVKAEPTVTQKIEAWFSRLSFAVRSAIHAVKQALSSSPSVEISISHISKPRNISKKDLPEDLKQALDEHHQLRSKLLQSKFEPATEAPVAADIKAAASSVGISSSAPVPEEIAGEKTFAQFVKLQSKDDALPESLGYFAFTPDCLAYAKNLTKTAIGRNVAALPNAVEIMAAKKLLSGYDLCKQREEIQEAKKIKAQEALARQEAESSKQPGQSSFEDFFQHYQAHEENNTPLKIYAGSKFLESDCMLYADNLPQTEAFESQRKAATYLSAWKANPAAAMMQAEREAGFRLPPPPARPGRRVMSSPAMPTTLPEPPRLTWEATVRDLPYMTPANRSVLCASLALHPKELDQAFAGLMLLGRKKTVEGESLDDRQAEAQSAEARMNYGRGQLSSIVTPNEVDELQQARGLLLKLQSPGMAERVGSIALIAGLLPQSKELMTAIDLQLQAMQPEKPAPKATALSDIPKLEEMNADEINRGSAAFNNYVNAFTRNIKAGKPMTFLPNSVYLQKECLAMADYAVRLIETSGGQGLTQNDQERFEAAVYLLGQADRRAV